MKPTFPPRRTLLLCTWSGERRRGKVYERLTHKNSDTPVLAGALTFGVRIPVIPETGTAT